MEQIKEANNLFKLHATQLLITLGRVYKTMYNIEKDGFLSLLWLLLVTVLEFSFFPWNWKNFHSFHETGSKFRRDRKECFSTQRRILECATMGFGVNFSLKRNLKWIGWINGESSLSGILVMAAK